MSKFVQINFTFFLKQKLTIFISATSPHVNLELTLLCNHLIETKLHNRIYFPHYYKGKKIVLHKRAQVLVADLWQLFEGKGLCNFSDIDGITMFADYRVPQSLQYFGAFQYSDSLFQDLKNEKLLGEYVPA